MLRNLFRSCLQVSKLLVWARIRWCKEEKALNPDCKNTFVSSTCSFSSILILVIHPFAHLLFSPLLSSHFTLYILCDCCPSNWTFQYFQLMFPLGAADLLLTLIHLRPFTKWSKPLISSEKWRKRYAFTQVDARSNKNSWKYPGCYQAHK